MRIFDTHAHIYPKKISNKASDTIGKFYNLPMKAEGATAEDLLNSGKKIGVEKYVVHSTATKKQQVKSINDFIISEVNLHSEFVGFATLHEDMNEDEIDGEVERVIAAGLKGIKLHPDFQRFDIDSKNAMKMYECLSEKLPVLFHVGDMRYDFSSPQKLHKVANLFPRLKCVAAHFGGYSRWDEALVLKNDGNVFFDTSSTLFRFPSDRAASLLTSLGYERFMFGVDFPMWTHREELDRFFAMKLSDKMNEAILSENAERILNI